MNVRTIMIVITISCSIPFLFHSIPNTNVNPTSKPQTLSPFDLVWRTSRQRLELGFRVWGLGRDSRIFFQSYARLSGVDRLSHLHSQENSRRGSSSPRSVFKAHPLSDGFENPGLENLKLEAPTFSFRKPNLNPETSTTLGVPTEVMLASTSGKRPWPRMKFHFLSLLV